MPNTKSIMRTKILVVDDEQPIIDALTYNLRKEGFETLSANDAESCLATVRREKPDLLILDVMLPAASGFDVVRVLRKQSDVPIILLTARAEETDRVVGLELGADDYVTKPFSMRELIARVKSVLRRRSVAEQVDENKPVVAGELVIDPKRHEVRLSGRPIVLSPKEFQLLSFLALHPNQVFSRRELLDRVWGDDAFVEERTVDVHIRWLREKIEDEPSQPKRLLTLRRVGYKLVP